MLHVFKCAIKDVVSSCFAANLLANAKTGPFILVMICSIPIKFEILAKIYYTILVLCILVFIYNHIPYVKYLILYLKIINNK